MTIPPFSARNRGIHYRIDKDFPLTARNGLLHLLIDLVEKNFVQNWGCVARELQRIARLPPTTYIEISSSQKQARSDTENILSTLDWEKVYDFCERLHNHLGCDVGYVWNDEFQITTPKVEVQSFISDELQRLFEEESLAFEFTSGLVQRRGRKHTVDMATKSQVVLGDPRFRGARKHYEKALHFFRNPSNPDYENCVKEAVCAVEAVGKVLFPVSKTSTLGDLAKWLATTKEVSIPKALIPTITGIYGFRNGGDGVGHGGATGGTATADVAEYVLAVCASQIIYLIDVSNTKEAEAPF